MLTKELVCMKIHNEYNHHFQESLKLYKELKNLQGE